MSAPIVLIYAIAGWRVRRHLGPADLAVSATSHEVPTNGLAVVAMCGKWFTVAGFQPKPVRIAAATIAFRRVGLVVLGKPRGVLHDGIALRLLF